MDKSQAHENNINLYHQHRHGLVTPWAWPRSASLTLSLTRYLSHPVQWWQKGDWTKLPIANLCIRQKSVHSIVNHLTWLSSPLFTVPCPQEHWNQLDLYGSCEQFSRVSRHKSNSAFNLSKRRMKVAKRYLVEQLLLAFVVKILSETRCICGQSGNRKAQQLLPFPRIFSLCI